jgi:hypothetical protein
MKIFVKMEYMAFLKDTNKRGEGKKLVLQEGVVAAAATLVNSRRSGM